MPEQYRPARGSELPIIVNVWPWIVGYGDETQLYVYRSTGVYDTDTAWNPVREHIERHGLVLVERRVSPAPDMVIGEREEAWYTTPELRLAVGRHPCGRGRRDVDN